MTSAVLTLPLLKVFLLLPALHSEAQTTSDGGHYINACYRGNINLTVEVTNLNSGQIVAESVVLALDGVAVNVASGSVDTINKTFAVGTLGSSYDNRVLWFNYSESNVTFLGNCTMPLITFGPSQYAGEVHCVVFSNGRLFVLYDAPSGNGIVAEVNTSDCSFRTLATSQNRVKGSLNGPGGQCVAVSYFNKLLWIKENSLELTVFDYESMTFQTATLTGFDQTAVTQLQGKEGGPPSYALLITGSDYYVIDGFASTNLAPPTVTKVSGGQGSAGSNAYSIFVDPGSDQGNTSDFKFASLSSGVYGQDSQNVFSILEEALPHTNKCQTIGEGFSAIPGATIASGYDWRMKTPYTQSTTTTTATASSTTASSTTTTAATYATPESVGGNTTTTVTTAIASGGTTTTVTTTIVSGGTTTRQQISSVERPPSFALTLALVTCFDFAVGVMI